MPAKLVLVVTVALVLLSSGAARAACGDGTIDPGEDCDVGGGGSVCCIGCMFQPDTTVCRSSVGECDVAENCTGSSADCPVDVKSTDECRGAFGAVASTAIAQNGVADAGSPIALGNGDFEFKIGAGATQTIAVTAATTLQELADAIDALAGVTASAAELAPGMFKLLMLSDDPGAAGTLTIVTDDTTLAVIVDQVGLDPPCDTAEFCDGVSDTCPVDVFLPASTVCRPSGGVCDVAENCPGTAPHICPPDTLLAPGTLCRASGGVCDLEETCSGTDATCPPDAKSTQECRASAGGCDPAEVCDGGSNACPADVTLGAGTECRAAAGDCDIAETCGVGAECPPDAFVAAGIECRAGAGQCDVAETCTGAAAACPPDGFEPDGASCDDGMVCTLDDMCVAGVCVAGPMNCGDGVLQAFCGEQCDDGNTDDGDGCDATCQAEAGLGCPATPLVGCRQPFVGGKSKVKIRDQEKIGGLKFKWQWLKGALTDVAEFGDPLTDAPGGTSYLLCVYDASGLLTQAPVASGGLCHVKKPRPCWKQGGSKKFKYKDPPQSIDPFGIKRIDLRSGTDGRAKVQVQGTGGLFDLPSNEGFGLPDLASITSPFTVQLQNTTGLCFETIFSAPFNRQEPGRFEDRAD